MTTPANAKLTIEAIRLLMSEIPEDDRHESWLDTAKELVDKAPVVIDAKPLDVKRLQGLRIQARQWADRLVKPDAEDKLGKEGVRAHAAKAMLGLSVLIEDALAAEETARALAAEAAKPKVDEPSDAAKPATGAAANDAKKTMVSGAPVTPAFKAYSPEEKVLLTALEAKPTTGWTAQDHLEAAGLIRDDADMIRGDRAKALQAKYVEAQAHDTKRIAELADPATPYDAAWTADAERLLTTASPMEVLGWAVEGSARHKTATRWVAEILVRATSLEDADKTWIDENRDRLPAHLSAQLLAAIAPPPPAFDPLSDAEAAAAQRLIGLDHRDWAFGDHRAAHALIRDGQDRVRGELGNKLEAQRRLAVTHRTQRLEDLVMSTQPFDGDDITEAQRHLGIQDPGKPDLSVFTGTALAAAFRLKAEHILAKPTGELGDATWMFQNRNNLPDEVNARFTAKTNVPKPGPFQAHRPPADSLPPQTAERDSVQPVRQAPVSGPFQVARPEPRAAQGGVGNGLPPSGWKPPEGAPAKKGNLGVVVVAIIATAVTLFVLILALRPIPGRADETVAATPTVASAEPTVAPAQRPAPAPTVVRPTVVRPNPVVRPQPPAPVVPALQPATRPLTAADLGVTDLTRVREGDILPSKLSRIVGTPTRHGDRLDYSGLQWRLPRAS